MIGWHDIAFVITDNEQEHPYFLRMPVRCDESAPGDLPAAERAARTVAAAITDAAGDAWRLIEGTIEVVAADDQEPLVYLVGSAQIDQEVRGVALTKTGAARLVGYAQRASPSTPVEVIARTPTEIEDGLYGINEAEWVALRPRVGSGSDVVG